MFIRLTRTDGRHIWINPEFIVTVEGRKDGGSIVVPGGDGLDYDVREAPDAIMRLCGGEAPAEVPAPEPSPPDPPPPDPNEALPIVNAPDLPVAQAEATVRALREKVAQMRKAAEAEKPVNWTPPDGKDAASAPPPAEEAATGASAEEKKNPKPAAKPRKRTSRSKKPTIDLTDEQLERLKKMAPGSRQKLLNTLAHLKVPNAEATAVALLAHKVIEIMPDNHVNWLVQ